MSLEILESLKEQFGHLDREEKRTFMAFVIEATTSPNCISPYDKNRCEEEIESKIDSIREGRFNKKFSCVHCESTDVKRNGKYRGRQRYLCRNCKRSFNDLTASPLASLKELGKFASYLKLMLDGHTLRTCAKFLKIDLTTSFYWRHKILNAMIPRQEEVVLDGVVECDETYIIESRKGERNIKDRAPKKRSEKANKPGLSKEQVAIMVAIDRNDNVFVRTSGYGISQVNQVEATVGKHLGKEVTFVTDGAIAFKRFTKKNSIEHIALRKGRRKRGVYHIQHVNSFHNLLKKWLSKFYGVATKYLNGYLQLYRFLHKREKYFAQDNFDGLLDCIQSSRAPLRRKDFPFVLTESNIDPSLKKEAA